MVTTKQHFDTHYREGMTKDQVWDLFQELLTCSELSFPVVYNGDYGGFHVSKALMDWLRGNRGWGEDRFYHDEFTKSYYPKEDRDTLRINQDLADAVEALPKETDLRVEWLNVGDSYEITEYDGLERVIVH